MSQAYVGIVSST